MEMVRVGEIVRQRCRVQSETDAGDGHHPKRQDLPPDVGASRFSPHPPAVEDVGRNTGHDIGKQGADNLAPQPEHPVHDGQDDQRGESRDHRHQGVADDLQPFGSAAEAPQPDQPRSSWPRGYSAEFRRPLRTGSPVTASRPSPHGASRRDLDRFGYTHSTMGDGTGGSLRVADPQGRARRARSKVTTVGRRNDCRGRGAVGVGCRPTTVHHRRH